MAKEEKKTNRFGAILKNIFFLIIILQFLPAFLTNIKKQINKVVAPNTHIGYLKISGMIKDDPSRLIKKIHKFQKNDEIKALVVKINSGGGCAGSSQAIFTELKNFQKEKPVIAVIDEICASGAYYIATATDAIISNPSSLIGSIGSKWVLPNVKEFINHHNIKVDEIKSGKFKTLLSMVSDRTPAETKLLQDFSDNVYQQFKSDVAAQRNLDLKKSHEWAEGKIFTGTQAIKLNLIDKLGSITQAKATLEQLLKDRGIEIKGKIKIDFPKQHQGLAKYLFGDIEDRETNSSISNMISCVITNALNKYLENEPNQSTLMY